MTQNTAASSLFPEHVLTDADDVLSPAEMELLTPKEIAQERKAKLEELRGRSWMSRSAREIAQTIPVSVFAMGDLACAAA